jgi:hypothetical protein
MRRDLHKIVGTFFLLQAYLPSFQLLISVFYVIIGFLVVISFAGSLTAIYAFRYLILSLGSAY